jgi:hypothetical protein
MLGLFSAISGHFSKSLILGTFLPAALFVISTLLFVTPLLPLESQVLRQATSLSTEWVVAVALVTMLLTALLHVLNTPLIRFYEGYPWKDSLVGRWRVAHYRAKLRNARQEASRAQMLIEEMRKRKTGGGRVKALENKHADAARAARALYPEAESSVLPTQLGNLIRAFENYPRLQYGMSSIPLWPRLISKIDKEYAGAVDDAKVPFDFMINVSALSTVMALALLGFSLLFPVPLTKPRTWVPWALEVVIFSALAYASYRGSVGRASAWGEMVKGAYDLYRRDLLKQLGYEDAPANIVEERKLWGRISHQIIFGDPPFGPGLEYKSPPVSARAKLSLEDLHVSRGVSSPDADGSLKVTLVVLNDKKTLAKKVIITDTLPDDFKYIWDTAKCEPATNGFGVSGANPYKFVVGDLVPGGSKKVTYKMRRTGCDNGSCCCGHCPAASWGYGIPFI